MPSHRAPRFSTRKTSAFAVAGVAAGSVLLMQGSAHAESLTQAKADYNTKMDQSEAADEAYDAATSQAATLQQKVNTLQAQISTDTAEMSSVDRTMGLQAAQQYESGGVSQTLQLALESSPGAYLDKALASNEIATKEAQLLKTLSEDKSQIAADQKMASTELALQQAAVATAQKQKTAALSAAASAKSLLNSLTAQQQQSIQQSENGVSSSSVHITETAAEGSRAALAVAYAESKLGDEYVYAGAGPDVFDCSGLTMEALAAAGISVTHNAAAQASEMPLVSEADIEPGYLVFYTYGDGITHVGIYVGNGMVIHAPHTGTVVQYGQINVVGTVVAVGNPYAS
jgi:cell wall-associated NlpC family hydrolase